MAWDEVYQSAYDLGFCGFNTAVIDVYMPYMMGCGLGGGEWDIYSTIVDVHCPGVIACKLV